MQSYPTSSGRKTPKKSKSYRMMLSSSSMASGILSTVIRRGEMIPVSLHGLIVDQMAAAILDMINRKRSFRTVHFQIPQHYSSLEMVCQVRCPHGQCSSDKARRCCDFVMAIVIIHHNGFERMERAQAVLLVPSACEPPCGP